MECTLVAQYWCAQHTEIGLEVRTTKAFHDRFIVLDKAECWHKAGNKAFMLSQVEDERNRHALVTQVEASWQEASHLP